MRSPRGGGRLAFLFGGLLRRRGQTEDGEASGPPSCPKALALACERMVREATKLSEGGTRPGGVGVPASLLRPSRMYTGPLAQVLPDKMLSSQQVALWQQRNAELGAALDELANYLQARVEQINELAIQLAKCEAAQRLDSGGVRRSGSREQQYKQGRPSGGSGSLSTAERQDNDDKIGDDHQLAQREEDCRSRRRERAKTAELADASCSALPSSGSMRESADGEDAMTPLADGFLRGAAAARGRRASWHEGQRRGAIDDAATRMISMDRQGRIAEGGLVGVGGGSALRSSEGRRPVDDVLAEEAEGKGEGGTRGFLRQREELRLLSGEAHVVAENVLFGAYDGNPEDAEDIRRQQAAAEEAKSGGCPAGAALLSKSPIGCAIHSLRDMAVANRARVIRLWALLFRVGNPQTICGADAPPVVEQGGASCSDRLAIGGGRALQVVRATLRGGVQIADESVHIGRTDQAHQGASVNDGDVDGEQSVLKFDNDDDEDGCGDGGGGCDSSSTLDGPKAALVVRSDSAQLASTTTTTTTTRSYRRMSFIDEAALVVTARLSAIARFLLAVPAVVEILLQSTADPDLAPVSGEMLHRCARFCSSAENDSSDGIARIETSRNMLKKLRGESTMGWPTDRNGWLTLEAYVLLRHLLSGCVEDLLYKAITTAATRSFLVMTTAFGTLREFLLALNLAAVEWLAEQQSYFFEEYRKLILDSRDYPLMRWGARFLFELLADPARARVMIAFVQDPLSLRSVMRMMLRRDAVAAEAFHLFKLFVACPRKTPIVEGLLCKHRNRLLLSLQDLKNATDGSRSSDAQQFEADRKLTIRRLLETVPSAGVGPISDGTPTTSQ